MRKLARRSLFLAGALAGVFVWAACGDDDDGFFTPVKADSGALADQGVPREATVVLADDSGPDDGGPVIFEAGPHDAGAVFVVDGGDIDGGIPCVDGGALEVEPNNSFATANMMNPPQSRCGVLRLVTGALVDAGPDAGDAGPDAAAMNAVESDFMTFRLTPGARDFFVQYQGDNIQIFITAGEDGGAQDITASPPPTLPFHPSDNYYLEVRSKDGQQHTWRVTLFQDF